MIDGEGDLSLPMLDRECTCLFCWSQSLDKMTQTYIKASMQGLQGHKMMNEAGTKFYVIPS